jgi:long-chain acyl-CoA synthetase
VRRVVVIRYSNNVTLEQHRPRTQRGAGRTVAWLAKQAELGLADLDLSLAQYRVLGLLTEGSAVSSAIAERLAVRPPSVTALIDGLEARGLVDRRTIEGDRRRVSLVVTPEGRRAIAAADAALDARLSAIAAMLGDDDGGEGAVTDLARWTPAMRAYHEARHRGER